MNFQRDVPASLSFIKRGSSYRASAPLKDLALFRGDPADVMAKATDSYSKALLDIKEWRLRAKASLKSGESLSARHAWELGDIIHKLNEAFANIGCRLEDLYSHLKRHAGLSAYRSSRCVTLRRYVSKVDAIPVDLKWSSMEKSVKATAQVISAGLVVA